MRVSESGLVGQVVGQVGGQVGGQVSRSGLVGHRLVSQG